MFASLSLVIAHDPEKCIGDHGCCGRPLFINDVACKNHYVVSWTPKECFYGDQEGNWFECEPMGGHEEIHEKVWKSHQNKKCFTDSNILADCCGDMASSSCAENYTTTWGSQCDKKMGRNHYKFYCNPLDYTVR